MEEVKGIETTLAEYQAQVEQLQTDNRILGEAVADLTSRVASLESY